MSPKRFCHSFLQHISPRTLLTMLLGHVSSTGFSNTLLEQKFLKHIFCTSFLNTFPWKQSRLGIIEGISQRPQNGRLLAEDQDRKPRTEPLDPLINGNPSLRYTFEKIGNSLISQRLQLLRQENHFSHSLPPELSSPLMLKPTNEPEGLANSKSSWTPRAPSVAVASCKAANFLDIAALSLLEAIAPSYPHVSDGGPVVEWFVVCLSSSLLAKGCGTHAIPWLCER